MLPHFAYAALLPTVLAGAPRPAPDLPALTVVATEFAFDAPDTVDAGPRRVRLVSRGREPHLLEIARLDDGRRVEDLVAHIAAHKTAPPWAVFVGGPTVPPNGGASEVTLDLAPGRYALLCPIPSQSDHKQHLAKGMVRTLTVVAPKVARPAAPAPRATPMVLNDYGFLFDSLGPGRQTLRVENRAGQPHEVVVVRLAPGRRVQDFTEWARTLDGPPPGELVGGTTAITRGQTALVPVDLRPGTYGLVCFVRDATDGRSHVAHGMVREFVVHAARRGD